MSKIKLGVAPDSEDERGPNLKERVKVKDRQRRVSRYSGHKSPIPAQIKDQGEFKKFFSAHRDLFIPYAGTDQYTAHSMLHFLLSLSDLSQTKSGVIESQQKFALGGKIDVVKRVDPEFNIESNDDVADAVKLEFVQFIKDNIELIGTDGRQTTIKQFYNTRLSYLARCGNFYYVISKAETLGQKKLQVRIIEPDECLYLAQDSDEVPLIAVSKIWSNEYLNRKTPVIYPRYPESIEIDGAERCMVHEKTEGRWYGRPSDMASMQYQFLEYQQSDYLNKQLDNLFTPKALIEFEAENADSVINDEDAQEAGFDDFADEIAHTYTNQSENPVSVMITERPSGARPVHVHEFESNTNENWYKVINDECERQILKANSWPKKLLGLSETSGLSTNDFMDVFQIADATTIKDLQESAGNSVNNILLKVAIEFFERQDLQEYSLEFSSPFKEMIKQEAEAEQEAEEPQPSEDE